MNKYIVSTLAFLCIACGMQKEPVRFEVQVPSDTKQTIMALQDAYTTIDKNIDSYTTITKDITGLSAEGGSATYYLEGDRVQRVDAILMGETGKSEARYYFANNKVFYVHNDGTTYQHPISSDEFSDEKIDVVKRNIFLEDGKIILLIEDGIQVKNPDELRSTASAVKVISEAVLREL